MSQLLQLFLLGLGPDYPPPKLKNLDFFLCTNLTFPKYPPPIEKLRFFPMYKFDFSEIPPQLKFDFSDFFPMYKFDFSEIPPPIEI